VIGATSMIGRAIVDALAARHDVIPASQRSTPPTVDLAQPDSIRALYRVAGPLDAGSAPPVRPGSPRRSSRATMISNSVWRTS
jgi:nucleoside-diphosphate-sugar epimerase